jgi:hypothetical protein
LADECVQFRATYFEVALNAVPLLLERLRVFLLIQLLVDVCNFAASGLDLFG